MGKCLGLSKLDWSHLQSHSVTVTYDFITVFFGRNASSDKIVPEVRLLIILWYTVAILIHHPQGVLGVGIPLVCRPAVPLCRLSSILWDTAPRLIHCPQSVLGVGIPLVCRPAVPLCRLS